MNIKLQLAKNYNKRNINVFFCDLSTLTSHNNMIYNVDKLLPVFQENIK